MNNNFFKDLKLYKNFNDVVNENNYKNVDSSWYILISDIKNSTKLVEEKRYKDVNFVASMSIISVINIDKEIQIAYSFGGDGSYILVPSSFIKKANKVLQECKRLADDLYGIDLRVSSYLLDDLYKKSLDLKIMKYEVSKNYQQTILRGNILEFIDKDIRREETLSGSIDEDYEVNFDGLECRWNEIKSPKDETLSILIKVKKNDEKLYKTILGHLENIAGNYVQRNPIKDENLVLSYDYENLKFETLIKSNKFPKVFKYIQMVFENLLANILFKIGNKDWLNYKNRMLKTCDNEKYENMLKMVISTTFEETKEIEKFLENEFENSNLAYGIHKSDSALMTCLIFQRHGNHVHFVDSNGGGYTMASRDLKNRLARLNLKN